MSSRSHAFAGSTARMAARPRSSSPLARCTTTAPSSLSTALDRRTGAKFSPVLARDIAQAVDKRLPTAVEIPDIAGESELQLLDGRAGGHPLGIIAVGAEPEECTEQHGQIARANRPVEPITQRDAVELPGVELRERRQETGQPPFLADGQKPRTDERTEPVGSRYGHLPCNSRPRPGLGIAR